MSFVVPGVPGVPGVANIVPCFVRPNLSVSRYYCPYPTLNGSVVAMIGASRHSMLCLRYALATSRIFLSVGSSYFCQWRSYLCVSRKGFLFFFMFQAVSRKLGFDYVINTIDFTKRSVKHSWLSNYDHTLLP